MWETFQVELQPNPLSSILVKGNHISQLYTVLVQQSAEKDQMSTDICHFCDFFGSIIQLTRRVCLMNIAPLWLNIFVQSYLKENYSPCCKICAKYQGQHTNEKKIISINVVRIAQPRDITMILKNNDTWVNRFFL